MGLLVSILDRTVYHTKNELPMSTTKKPNSLIIKWAKYLDISPKKIYKRSVKTRNDAQHH